MGATCYILGSLVVLGAVYIYRKVTKVRPVPKIEEKWWGPGEDQNEDTAIKPFKINVSDEIIKDLQDRLKNALPLQPPLEGVNHNYGLNTNLLETIVDYWKTKYNWNERQEFLNKFPQFQTNIQGLNIHFIHAKPTNVPQRVEILPLLLLHGWPGSVREFYEIIPILTTPQDGSDFVFEVIAPSLPGYGFSDGAVRPGLGPAQIAQLFNKLMIRLNFDRYYVQGGDWGSIISQAISVLYPENVIGVHRNWSASSVTDSSMIVKAFWPSLFFTKKEIEKNYPLSKVFSNFILEFGYFHLQATKPDTVAVALRDSPVGLAAYIIEKFITWTDQAYKDLPDGGLTKHFTLDKLLDNVMIYWVTRSITTSVRLYAESMTKENRKLGVGSMPIKVPAGCNRFEHEISYPPESVIRKRHLNLIHLTDFEYGGHFPALELPEVLAKDIFQFVRKVRRLPNEIK